MKVTDKLTITNEDCMELMGRYPDGHFDLCISDPPYGIGAPNMAATKGQRKRGANRLNGCKLPSKENQSNYEWDNSIPTLEYFDCIRRKSQNQIIWGGNYFPLPPARCVIVWDKCQPWENFSQVELAWTNFDAPASLFKFDNRTGDKIHPTQKPVALYKWLLDRYAKPIQAKLDRPMRILDTHLGSGSIAIACHDYGYDLTACELDPDYYNAAIKRIQNHTAQTKLW